MLALCIDRLGAAGYVYIGMEHFARPDDALTLAQQLRRLHRNFQMLMCNFELSLASIEQAYAITFTTYFASELAQLQTLEADGLLSIDAQWLNVMSRGRLLIRTICMVFDRYLDRPAATPQAPQAPQTLREAQFSRTI